MPIYESETTTLADLNKLRKTNMCRECGARLNVYLDRETGKAFVACWDYLRTGHEGIVREASRYEKEGIGALTIKARREIVNNQFGEETTTALEKRRIPISGALTESQAMHILKLVYPNVPNDEIVRTAILCRDFGLHPLMKEVYIIGFENKRTGKKEYSTVVGISASRKMAADKKGAYSFLDDTPRAATPEEIDKQFGKDSEEQRDNLISVCKVKGEKGNEATGFGLWPKDKTPYGMDKGNNQRNMANIRSERPAYSRLPGVALPQIEVIDEAYAEVPKLDTTTGEITEPEVEPEPAPEAPPVDPEPSELKPSEILKEETESKDSSESKIDMPWLIESVNKLKWDILKYIREEFQVSTDGSLKDVVSRLNYQQQEQLVKGIQDRLDLR